MSDISIPILYVIVFFNLILSLIIISRGLGKKVYILFGLIPLSVAFWAVSIINFYEPVISLKGTNWLTWTHFSAMLIAFFFFYFSLYFPKKIISNKFYHLLVPIPFLGSLYLLFFSKSIFGETIGIEYEIGSSYMAYQSILLAYFFAGFAALFLQYKKATQENKKQVLYVLASSIVSSTLALMTDLIFPYFGIFSYTWLGPIFTIILVISIFIAILKYNLFDIKVILTELLSIFLIVVLFSRLFFTSSLQEIYLNISILIIVTILTSMLIKSVYKEVETRKKMEGLAKDLKIANAKLKKMDKQKSEFINIASHQLRGPVASLKGYSSMILEGSYGPISKKVTEIISRLFQSSSALALIIDDFLNLSRIERGKIEFNFEERDIKEIIKEAFVEVKKKAEDKKIKLTFNSTKSDYKSNVDAEKIRQIVANIIDNAIKYTPEGSIEVNLSKKEKTILLKVSDTGIGIPKGSKDKLFKKFSRLENANEGNISGTGLGLYLAKEVVSAHKGKIWAESKGKNEGSTFFIELISTTKEPSQNKFPKTEKFIEEL